MRLKRERYGKQGKRERGGVGGGREEERGIYVEGRGRTNNSE